MKRFPVPVVCTAWLLCSGLALGGLAALDRTEPRDDLWKEHYVAPEALWSQSKDGFSAMLLLSDQPDDVLKSWEIAEASVPVRTADTITRGVPIVAFVFFSGCRPDEDGMCNASADFTILRPDGSEYENFNDRDLWKQKPAPPAGMLRLSAEYVGVVIEPRDPLGEYEILVTVHDLNAGTTLELRQAFTATAGR